MDYRRNEDKWRIPETPAYNAVLEMSFSAESANEPITKAEVKSQLNIPDAVVDFDTKLDRLIKEVRVYAEQYTHTSLIPRTVTAIINNSLGHIELPFGPVTGAIVSMHDYDDTPVTSDTYRTYGLDFKKLEYPLYDWLKVVYPAGYTDANIPADLKGALIRLVVHYFEHAGEETKDLSPDIVSVLDHYKNKRVSWLA